MCLLLHRLAPVWRSRHRKCNSGHGGGQSSPGVINRGRESWRLKKDLEGSSPVARTRLRDEEFDITPAHTVVSGFGTWKTLLFVRCGTENLGRGGTGQGGAKKFEVAGEASRHRPRRCFISVGGSLARTGIVFGRWSAGAWQSGSSTHGLLFRLASPNGVKATANGRPIQARSRRSAHASLTSRGWAWCDRARYQGLGQPDSTRHAG